MESTRNHSGLNSGLTGKISLILFVFILILFPVRVAAQLSGTYTIDPAGAAFDTLAVTPNFRSFTEAVDTLHSHGVDGPVVVNVVDGTYVEKFQINTINGASAANRVTFQSQSLDSTKVILRYENTSSAWTLRFHNTGFVTFRKMRIQGDGSYGRVININGTANNCIIENCQLWSPGNTTGGTEIIGSWDDETSNITIRNNYFLNGYKGIYMDGIGTDQMGKGLQVYGNTFIEQGVYGVQVSSYEAPKIYNNSFDLDGGTSIRMERCYDDMEVTNNTIIMGKGIGIDIDRNRGNAGMKGLVANNFIRMGWQGEKGIVSYICEYLNIWHNTVHITHPSTSMWVCCYWQDDYSPTGYSSDIDLKNNIFVNTGGGPTLLIESDWSLTSDHNNYYTTGDVLFNYAGEHPDLESFQDATGRDANSVSVDPRFLGSFDLHSESYWLNGVGDATLGITTDIDGETRSMPPDIGADEFDPVTPLSGPYTIGGTDPDYATVKDAMDDLQSMGVIGPTTFNIRNGNYVEYIGKVRAIPGASDVDSIVLTSETGSYKNVSISYENDNTDQNIFYMLGVDHFTFSDLTIKSTDDTYGRPLYIKGDVENINLLNCEFSLAHPNDWAVVAIIANTADDIVIKGNKFSGGGRALTFAGNDVNSATNTLLEGNEVEGARIHGLKLSYQIAPRIIKNTITNTDNAQVNFAPLHLTNCKQAMEVIGNSIACTKAKNGIYMQYCQAVDPYRARIANNMIQVGDEDITNGIKVRSCERQDFYHNSVHVTTTDTTYGRGIDIREENAEINIVNNILANSGGGYALVVEDPTDVTLSDYNALYVVGDSLASWGGVAYPDIPTLNAATDMDGHSVTDDPLFESATDLHINQVAYQEAGKPVGVRYDIDGNARDTLLPDIGAMEFYCETPDFNIWVSKACAGDTTFFIDSSLNITDGAQFGWDFDGDYSPDYTSGIKRETVAWVYEEPGQHTLNFIVNQVEGCDDFEPVIVEVGAPPEIEITTTDEYCGTENGVAEVSVLNPSGTYSYYWSTGSTDMMISDLGKGTYTVAVSDETGCTSSGEAVIEEAVKVEVTQLKGSTCGKSDGIAEVSVSGGVAPYNYVWANGVTEAVDSFLTPGLTYVNVIDGNDCSIRGSIVITHDGSGPTISLVGKTDNDCYGERAGAINIGVSGGSSPYRITWSTGDRTEDLENLRAGVYDVTVVDSDTCPTSATFRITEPPMMTIGSVVEEASCSGDDGRAAVLVSGGTKPYNFVWSSGQEKPLAENLESGIYSVTVTDANDCEVSEPVIVNSVGGPLVSLKTLTGVKCGDETSGAISINTSGGTPLYTWLWTEDGSTTPNVSGLSEGEYGVKVTDNAGCNGYNSFTVGLEPPAINPICLVTVDTATGMNMVVWEKLDTAAVSHYNVYRETSVAGEYTLIGSVGVDEESLYVDSIADPTIRSWRYKLSVVDRCGSESELSEVHKTMHLTINLGLEGAINLIWDHYEGFPIVTYEIFRYSASEGWKNIASMPSTLTSYTDANPPAETVSYFIEVEHPTGCISDDKKASTLNSSKSNRQNRKKSGDPGTGFRPQDRMVPADNLKLFPNPGTGIYNLVLELEEKDDVRISVYDITGKYLMSVSHPGVVNTLETQLDLSEFPAGMYRVMVQTGSSVINSVLIKK